MKRIIAATMTAMLLCSASVYAQTPAQDAAKSSAAAPAPAAPAGAPNLGQLQPGAAPLVDVDKLAPNQREYLVTAIMSSGGQIVPQQVAKFKEMYDKMTPDNQLQLVTKMVQILPSLTEKQRNDIINNIPPPK